MENHSLIISLIPCMINKNTDVYRVTFYEKNLTKIKSKKKKKKD